MRIAVVVLVGLALAAGGGAAARREHMTTDLSPALDRLQQVRPGPPLLPTTLEPAEGDRLVRSEGLTVSAPRELAHDTLDVSAGWSLTADASDAVAWRGACTSLSHAAVDVDRRSGGRAAAQTSAAIGQRCLRIADLDDPTVPDNRHVVVTLAEGTGAPRRSHGTTTTVSWAAVRKRDGDAHRLWLVVSVLQTRP